MGSPFTSDDISYFNHEINSKKIQNYINFHKYVLIIYIFICITFILYYLYINAYA